MALKRTQKSLDGLSLEKQEETLLLLDCKLTWEYRAWFSTFHGSVLESEDSSSLGNGLSPTLISWLLT